MNKYNIRKIEGRAREHGYTQLYIESFPEFSKAVSLYEKSGFRHIAMLTGNPYFQIHPYQNEKDLFDKIDNILLK